MTRRIAAILATASAGAALGPALRAGQRPTAALASGDGWPGTTQTPVREELIGPPTTLISAGEEVWKFFAQVSR